MNNTKGIKPIRGNDRPVTLKLNGELVDAFRAYAGSKDLSFSQAVRIAMRLLLDTESSKDKNSNI